MYQKHVFFFAFLFFFLGMKAQVMIPDSVSTIKSWNDKNGGNKLKVKVSAAFNAYDEHYVHPQDGNITVATATLINNNYQSTVTYRHKEYMLMMLSFYDEAIWFHEIDGVQAVFIPVFHTGMLDTQVSLSYLILYNKKKYSYSFTYTCHEGEEDATCVLMMKDIELEKKLRRLPEELRTVLINYLQTVYTTRNDLTPIHTTFRGAKYKLSNQPNVDTDYQASYPYILLDKICDLIESASYETARMYLTRFESERYHIKRDYYDMEEEEVGVSLILDGKLVMENRDEYLNKAKALTYEGHYIEAYQIYKTILGEQE